jgi:hypothetical protein
LVRPVHWLYLPVSHCVHSCELDGWYLPSSQLLQLAEATMAYLPFAHIAQDAAL